MVKVKIYYIPRACLLSSLQLLSLALWNKCSPQQAMLSPPQPAFFSSGYMQTQITTRRTVVLYPRITIFALLHRRRQDKRFLTEWKQIFPVFNLT